MHQWQYILVTFLVQDERINMSHFDMNRGIELYVLNSATGLVDEIMIGYGYAEILRCYTDKAKC